MTVKTNKETTLDSILPHMIYKADSVYYKIRFIFTEEVVALEIYLYLIFI